MVAMGLAAAIVPRCFHRHDSAVIRTASAAGTSAAPQPAAIPAEVSATIGPFPNVEITATDEQLLNLARTAVAKSPDGAIGWARLQKNSILRRRLLFAVVRAWGEREPTVAVDWALAQDEAERRMDMQAALMGAVKQPAVALAVVRGLLKYDPDNGAECRSALIVALDNAGQFQMAVEFLKDAPVDSRADSTEATFRRWGADRPQEALKALDAVPDQALRKAAFRALADGWSASDPAGLANYATSLPTGEEQSYALGKALANWSLQDPAAVAAWLNTSPAGVNFDAAVAQLISRTDGANRSPEIAMQWVQRISDPSLQEDSLAVVLDQWVQSDPRAAKNYLANASWIGESRREQLLKELQNVDGGSVKDL